VQRGGEKNDPDEAAEQYSETRKICGKICLYAVLRCQQGAENTRPPDDGDRTRKRNHVTGDVGIFKKPPILFFIIVRFAQEIFYAGYTEINQNQTAGEGKKYFQQRHLQKRNETEKDDCQIRCVGRHGAQSGNKSLFESRVQTAFDDFHIHRAERSGQRKTKKNILQ